MDDPILDLFAESKNPPKPKTQTSNTNYEDLLANPNVQKALSTIRKAEGANYNTLFGGKTFNNYNWHPLNKGAIPIPNGKTTSAAGGYQYQRGTWENIAKQLGLKDFSPKNQDIGAIKLIKDRGALDDVLNGNVEGFYNKVKPEWESFVKKPLSEIQKYWGGSQAQTEPPPTDLFAESKGFNPEPVSDLFAESQTTQQSDPIKQGFQSEPDPAYMAQFTKDTPKPPIVPPTVQGVQTIQPPKVDAIPPNVPMKDLLSKDGKLSLSLNMDPQVLKTTDGVSLFKHSDQSNLKPNQVRFRKGNNDKGGEIILNTDNNGNFYQESPSFKQNQPNQPRQNGGNGQPNPNQPNEPQFGVSVGVEDFQPITPVNFNEDQQKNFEYWAKNNNLENSDENKHKYLEFQQNNRNPSSGMVEAQNNQEILEKGSAGTVPVDLKNKPKGENTGKYLLRYALEQIAPNWNLTPEEINQAVDEAYQKQGKYTYNHDTISDDFIEKTAQNGQPTVVQMSVTNKLVNDILNKRNGEFGKDVQSVEQPKSNDPFINKLAKDQEKQNPYINPELNTDIQMKDAQASVGNRDLKGIEENDAEEQTRREIADAIKNPQVGWASIGEDAGKGLAKGLSNLGSPISLYKNIREDLANFSDGISGITPQNSEAKFQEVYKKQIDDIKKDFGSFKEYQRTQNYIKDLYANSPVELGVRTVANYLRSTINTAISSNLQGLDVIDKYIEKVNPIDQLMPEWMRPNLRNLENGIGYTIATLLGKGDKFQRATPDTDANQRLFSILGKRIKDELGEDKYLRSGFLKVASENLGNMTGFMLLGMLAPELSIGKFSVTSAISGALGEAGSMYEQAKQKGYSENTSLVAGFVGTLMGATEGAGAGAALNKALNHAERKAFFGRVIEFAKDTGKEILKDGAEEFGQETLQNVGEDAFFKYLEQKDSKLAEKVITVLAGLPNAEKFYALAGVAENAYNVIADLPQNIGKNAIENGVPAGFFGGLFGQATNLVMSQAEKAAGRKSDLEDNDIQNDVQPLSPEEVESKIAETKQKLKVGEGQKVDTQAKIKQPSNEQTKQVQVVAEVQPEKPSIDFTPLAESVNALDDSVKGKKQLNRAITNIGDAKGNPIKILNEVNRVKLNLSQMGKEADAVRQALKPLEENLKAQGYELVDLLGKEYDEGMNVVGDMEPMDNLQRGEQRIKRVIKPQIMKDGEMIHPAEVVIGYHPDETPQDRENWLNRNKSKNEKIPQQTASMESGEVLPTPISTVKTKVRQQEKLKFAPKNVQAKAENEQVTQGTFYQPDTTPNDMRRQLIETKKANGMSHDEAYNTVLAEQEESGKQVLRQAVDGDVLLDSQGTTWLLDKGSLVPVDPVTFEPYGADVIRVTEHTDERDEKGKRKKQRIEPKKAVMVAAKSKLIRSSEINTDADLMKVRQEDSAIESPNTKLEPLTKGDQVTYKGQTFEVDKVAQSGKVVALKGDKSVVAPVDKVEKVEPTRQVIGKGNSGELTADNEFVYKNPKAVEVQIHNELKNKIGIAPAEEKDGKLVRKKYREIVSIDTIKEKRERYAPILKKNYERINNAISELSKAGYYYNDPMQFGWDGKNLDLLDFGNAQKENDPTRSNFSLLSAFYKTFGAPELAKLNSDAFGIQGDIVTLSYVPDYTATNEAEAKALQGAMEVRKGLGDAKPDYIYFTRNARLIPKHGAMGQTNKTDGIKYVFSENILPESFTKEWELTPIYAPSSVLTEQNKLKESLPKTAKDNPPKSTLEVGDQFTLPNKPDIFEVIPSGKYSNKGYSRVKNLTTGEVHDKPFTARSISKLKFVDKPTTELQPYKEAEPTHYTDIDKRLQDDNTVHLSIEGQSFTKYQIRHNQGQFSLAVKQKGQRKFHELGVTARSSKPLIETIKGQEKSLNKNVVRDGINLASFRNNVTNKIPNIADNFSELDTTFNVDTAPKTKVVALKGDKSIVAPVGKVEKVEAKQPYEMTKAEFAKVAGLTKKESYGAETAMAVSKPNDHPLMPKEQIVRNKKGFHSYINQKRGKTYDFDLIVTEMENGQKRYIATYGNDDTVAAGAVFDKDGDLVSVKAHETKIGLPSALLDEARKDLGNFSVKPPASQQGFNFVHKYFVKKALSEGKTVPQSVLAEYPDLAEKFKGTSSPETAKDNSAKETIRQKLINNEEVDGDVLSKYPDLVKEEKERRDTEPIERALTRANHANVKTEPLLLPEVVNLSPSQIKAYEEKSALLKQHHFDTIQLKTDVIGIKTKPNELPSNRVVEAVKYLLNNDIEAQPTADQRSIKIQEAKEQGISKDERGTKPTPQHIVDRSKEIQSAIENGESNEWSEQVKRGLGDVEPNYSYIARDSRLVPRPKGIALGQTDRIQSDRMKYIFTDKPLDEGFQKEWEIEPIRLSGQDKSQHVQTETNNEIEQVPISQRVDVDNIEDGEFTRAEVAEKAKTEKIRSKTGFTKTQEEWFIGELQKEYDKLEPTAKMVQMDKGSLANLVWELGKDEGKYTHKSPDFIRTTPEYLEAKKQYENDIKNAVVIDIPGDGVFKFSSAYGINKIHKKLTGKTIEEFRKANNKDYELPSLPKNYGKAGKEAQIRQEDETDITPAKVNELLGDAPETSKELSDLGVNQVSNGYWINNNDGLNGFTFEPNPKPIQLSNLKGFDLFAHKYNTVKGNSSSKYSEWRISDAVTGRMLVSGESLDDVIEKAKNVKPEQFEKALTKSLSDGKTSPRYEQSQPQSKSEQTPKALKMVADDEKNLIVAHNLSEENLLFTDKIGGLAMPSLAITNKDIPFDSYGEITLIGDKGLASPNSQNPVTDADMYSPRYPSIHYQVHKSAFNKAFDSIWKSIKPVKDKIDYSLDYDLNSYYQLRKIENDGVDALLNNDAFKVYYLKENGESVPSDIHDIRKIFYDAEVKNKLKDFAEDFLNPLIKDTKIAKDNGRYVPLTLENIVKDMKSRMKEGEGFNYGVGNLRATAAKRFKNLAEIQGDRQRITSKKELEPIKKEMSDKFIKLYDQYASYYPNSEKTFGMLDKFSEAIGEGLRRKNLKRALSEYGFEGIDNYKPIENYLNQLISQPTEYFEAKPQRAVGLDEFKAAIVPNDISAQARKILTKKRLELFEYDPNVKGDRQRAVTEATTKRSDVLFKKRTTEDLAEQQKLREANTVETLLPQMKSSVTADGVEISLADAEIIRRINDTLTDGDMEKSSSIDGLFFPPELIADTIEGIDAIIENGQEAGYDETDLQGLIDLKKNIQLASAKNGTTKLYAFDDAIKHETGHEVDYLEAIPEAKDLIKRVGDLDGKGNVDSFLATKNADGEQILPAIVETASKYFFNRHGYTTNTLAERAVLVQEVWNYIQTGDAEKIGLSPEQEATFKYFYMKAYIARNGEQVLDSFAKFYQQFELDSSHLETIRNEIKEKTQSLSDIQGTQTGDAVTRKGSDSTLDETSGTAPKTESETDRRLPARSAEVEKRQQVANTPINFEPSGKLKPSQTPETLRRNNIEAKDRVYVSTSNVARQTFADAILDEGVESAQKWLDNAIKDKENQSGATAAVAFNLMNHYGKLGDLKNLNKVADDILPMITDAAQMVQSVSLVNMYNPEQAGTYATKLKKQKTGSDITEKELAKAQELANQLQNTTNNLVTSQLQNDTLTKENDTLAQQVKDNEQALNLINKRLMDTKLKLSDVKGLYTKVKKQFERLQESKPPKQRVGVPYAKLVKELEVNKNDILERLKKKFGNNVALKMVAGEKGIAKLSDAAIRKQNLDVAKEMELAGKDAKTIWLATGWEKGVEGKWKNEIPDGDFITKGKFYHQKLKDFKWKYSNLNEMFASHPEIEQQGLEIPDYADKQIHKLGDVYDAPEMFKAYPELKNYKVQYARNINYYLGESGAFDPKTKTITFQKLEDAQTIVKHEIQHAIQLIEGFAKGGNTASASNLDKETIDEIHNVALEVRKAQQLKNSGEWIYESSTLTDIIQNGNQPQKIKDWAINIVKQGEQAIDEFIDSTPIQQYRRLGGEVESRNVEKRGDMSAFERSQTPLFESEDVPRDKQIVLKMVAEPAPIKIEQDEVDFATLKLIDALKNGTTPSDFINDLDNSFNGKLTPFQLQQLHAEAVNRLQSSGQPLSEEQRALGKNRNQHRKLAKEFTDAEQIKADEIKKNFVNDYLNTLKNTQKDNPYLNIITKVVELAKGKDLEAETVAVAVSKQKGGDIKSILNELQTEFPDLSEKDARKVIRQADELLKEAKRSIEMDNKAKKFKIAINEKDLQNFKNEQKMIQREKSKINFEMRKFYEALGKTKLELAGDTITGLRRANLLSTPLGIFGKSIAKDIASTGLFNVTDNITDGMLIVGDALLSKATGAERVIAPRLNFNAFKSVFKADEAMQNLDKKSGLATMYEILMNGEDIDEAIKKDYIPTDTKALAERMFKDGTKWQKMAENVGSVVDWYIDKVFRTRGMYDAISKVYAFRKSLEQQASVIAKNEGLSKDERMNLILNPTNVMQIEAMYYAEDMSFQNDNVVNDYWQSLQSKSKAGKFVLSQVFPFAKTVSNVLYRVLEHTPLGFAEAGRQKWRNKENLKSKVEDKYREAVTMDAEKSSDWSQLNKAQQLNYIDAQIDKILNRQQKLAIGRSIARASFGTAGLALGYFLAMAGLMAGALDFDDDKEESARRRRKGIENNSVDLGKFRFTVPETPFGTAMAIGATIADNQKLNTKAGYSTVNPFVDAAAESFYEQAKSLPQIRGSLDFLDNQTFPSRVGTFFAPYLTPSWLSEWGNIGDDKDRTGKTYYPSFSSDKFEKNRSKLTEFGRPFAQRLPGLRQNNAEIKNQVPLEERGGFWRKLIRANDPVNVRVESDDRPQPKKK